MGDGINALVVSSSLFLGRGLHPREADLIAGLIRETPSGRAVTCHECFVARHAIESGQYNVVIIPFEWGEDGDPYVRILDGLVAFRFLGKVLSSKGSKCPSEQPPLLVVYGWRREFLDDSTMFGFAKIHNAHFVGEPNPVALVGSILAERRARKARVGGEQDVQTH